MIKKYSRLISFLFFIEYGAFISVVLSVFFKVSPKDEYAELARHIGAALLLHSFLCVALAVFTGTAIGKRLKLDAVTSTLYAMLGALAPLALAPLIAAIFLLLPSQFFSQPTVIGRMFEIFAVASYFVALILPYFLIFRHLRKKPNFTPE